MGLVRSFPPVIDKLCKILILGTVPSERSLAKKEYYADGRNDFWPIIYSFFNSDRISDYEQRKAFLLSKTIATWDVVEEYVRRGSSDRNITDVKPNNFVGLFKDYGNIAYIGFNGQRAAQLFEKHIGLDLPGFRYVILPSSSAASRISLKSNFTQVEDCGVGNST